jgi:hypothetical protein
MGNAIMLPPEQAAVLTQMPTRLIYRWIESGSVHYRDVSNGSLIVCMRSLVAAREQLRGINDDQTSA